MYIKSDMISPLGISIPFSSVLETLVSNNLQNQYMNWFINIRTWYEHYMDCLDGNVEVKTRILKLHKTTLAKEIADDINNFLHILNDKRYENLNIVFYYPTYRTIEKYVSNFRTIDDFKGFKHIVRYYEKTMLNAIISYADINVNKIDYVLPLVPKTIITTHAPMDLLNFTSISDNVLLEPFTGKLKLKRDWYTKYHPLGKKDMSVFPFVEELFWILGDKHFVKPYPVKIRERLYELAIKKNWTYTTGKVKVRMDLRLYEPEIYRLVSRNKKFYRPR